MKYKKFLKLGARKFHFLKYKENFFYRKYKKVFNLGTRNLQFLKYKKKFFWKNIRNFLESILFIFFIFEFWLKSAPGSSIYSS